MSSPDIQALIQGEITGQVAVGTQIVQIGSIHGGVVNLASQPVTPRARPLPVYLRPRPFPQLLDRESEVRAVAAAFDAGVPAEIYGPAGIGKTTLLRYLSHHQFAAPFPDGVIHLSARMQPASDVLQSLYEAFYETDVAFKPTDAQMRLALRERRALVLIDDVDFPREDLERLMDAAPTCTFLAASLERRLWGDVRAIEARGLPDEAALALVERALEAPLAAEEREPTRALCAALQGHPLRILQAIAAVRAEGRSLAEVAADAKAGEPGAVAPAAFLDSLAPPEGRTLAVLAALGGAPIEAAHAGAIADVADVDAVLERLLQRGLVQVQDSRYSVTGTLADEIRRRDDLSPLVVRASSHFTAWARRHNKTPERVAAASAALLALVSLLARQGRWAEALDLVRASEGAMALASRWGAWARLLGVGLEASRAINNPGAEAWALHQLGTRALCLDDRAAARDLLRQALDIRESLGDMLGAAATGHNLNILVPVPPSDRSESASRPARETVVPTPKPVPLLKALLVALPITAILTGVGVWYALSQRDTGALAVAAGSVQFGSVEVGTTSDPREITVVNSGSRPVRVTSVAAASPGGDFASVAETCTSAAVPPGGTCAVRLTFTPRAEGERMATLTIQRDAGPPLSIEVGGTGTPPVPAASIEPQRLEFGSLAAGASSSPREVVLTNAGRGRLTLGEARLAGPGAGAFVKATDECSGATLDAGARCRVLFRFVPQAPGDQQATFEIESNAAGSPHRIALTGRAHERLVAVLSLSPRQLDFGQVVVGTASPPRTMTVTNTGTAPLRVRAIAFGGPHASDYIKTADGCTGATISPGGACRVAIVSRPRGGGARQATLTFDSNAEGSPHVIRFGTAVPVVTSFRTAPEALDFGDQEIGVQSSGRTIRVTNTGTGPLLVRRVEVGGAHAIDFVRAGDRCTNVRLGPGQDCSVTFAFRPGIAGERSAFVTILATDAPRRIPLRGVGAVGAGLEIRPQSVDFGEQELGTTGPARTITLVNVGAGPLQVRIFQGGDHTADFTRAGDTCTGTPLGPRASCTITVTFTPQREGLRQSFLTIVTPREQRQIDLAGTGGSLHASLEAAPSSLDFGQQQLGTTSRPRPVEIRNAGARRLAGMRVAVTGAERSDFSIDNRCGAAIDAGQRCVVMVAFAPLAAGARTAAVLIGAEGVLIRIALSGSGQVRQVQAAVPRIVRITFPDRIPANGARIGGRVDYEDPDGNVTLAEFEVVRGSFTPFRLDPGGRGQPVGAFDFVIFCTQPQTVVLRLTLHDAEGNKSDPEVFSFACAQITPPTQVPPLSVPQSLSPGTRDPGRPADLSCQSVILRWEPADGAGSYEVLLARLDPTRRIWLPLPNRVTARTSLALGSLAESTVVRWAVRSRGAGGRLSPPSATHYFRCVIVIK